MLKVKASQIIYHMRLHWQLPDKVTCRSSCYVCCFAVNFGTFEEEQLMENIVLDDYF